MSVAALATPSASLPHTFAKAANVCTWLSHAPTYCSPINVDFSLSSHFKRPRSTVVMVDVTLDVNELVAVLEMLDVAVDVTLPVAVLEMDVVAVLVSDVVAVVECDVVAVLETVLVTLDVAVELAELLAVELTDVVTVLVTDDDAVEVCEVVGDVNVHLCSVPSSWCEIAADIHLAV